jgi:hypothetical protein
MSELELILRIATFTELGLLISLLFTHGASNRNYHAATILLLGVASYVLAPLLQFQQRFQSNNRCLRDSNSRGSYHRNAHPVAEMQTGFQPRQNGISRPW